MPKVYALKDNVKKHIFHPSNKIRFDENGVADWPLDQFTTRRIRDGDVSLEAPPKKVEHQATSRRSTTT
jgi:hypothetical protein